MERKTNEEEWLNDQANIDQLISPWTIEEEEQAVPAAAPVRRGRQFFNDQLSQPPNAEELREGGGLGVGEETSQANLTELLRLAARLQTGGARSGEKSLIYIYIYLTLLLTLYIYIYNIYFYI